MPGEFAVVGLGMFGRSVALHLARAGQAVLAVDRDPRLVNELADQLDDVVCADATDEDALRELGVSRFTSVVVAIGAASMENSILTTALLRQLGVPRIVARSMSPLHTRVLRAVGAHEVVSPEEEMGERLARRLATPSVLERLEVAANAELAEVEVPESLVGQSLAELDIRRRWGISVVAVRRGGAVHATVDAAELLRSGDVLIVLGEPAAITRLGNLV